MYDMQFWNLITFVFVFYWKLLAYTVCMFTFFIYTCCVILWWHALQYNPSYNSSINWFIIQLFILLHDVQKRLLIIQ